MASMRSFSSSLLALSLAIVTACADDQNDPDPDPTPTPVPAPQCGNNFCEAGEGTTTCYTDCVPGGGDAVPATYTASLQVYPNASVATVVNRDSETIYCSGRVYGFYYNGASEMLYWRGHNAVAVGGSLDVPVYSSPAAPFVRGDHTITCRKPAE